MPIKRYKPTSPGRRDMSVVTFDDITTKKPHKPLLEPLKSKAGRNNQGRITTRHRGGGHKRMYRIIDFKRNKDGVAARVATIEYDPNRSARIALLFYEDGEKRYIIAPNGLKVGDTPDERPRGRDPRRQLPADAQYPARHDDAQHRAVPRAWRANLVRSAGNAAQLMAREGNYATLRMPSGEMRMIPVTARATIGQVGNPDHQNQNIGKAGRSRHMGRRPSVRGSVMNPNDHPHGGGEGRAPIGGQPQTPWGKPAMGARTRHNKTTDKFIVRRRKK